MKQKDKEPAYPQRKPKKSPAEVALAAAKAQLDENAKELAALRAEVDHHRKIADKRSRDFIRMDTRMENEYDYAIEAFKRYGVFGETWIDAEDMACPLRFGVDIALAGWMKAEAANRIKDAHRNVSWSTEPSPEA